MPEAIRRKVTAGFGAALVVLAIVGALSYRSTLALLSTVDEQSDAQEMVTSLQLVLANLNAAEGAHRGYMITHDPAHFPRYNRSIIAARAAVDEVLRVADKYPEDRAALDTLHAAVEDRIRKFEDRTSLFERDGLIAVAPLLRGDPEDKRIAAQIAKIETDVRQRLAKHRASTDTLARLTLGVIVLGSLLAFVFLLLARFLIQKEIHGRHEAYREIGESEERLNDLIESASELIQLLTPEGRITNVNAAWLKTLRYRRDQLENIDIMDVVHPGSHEVWCAAVARALKGEQVRDVAVDFRARDGEKVNVLGSISCRFDEERPVSVRAIFRDVTATQRAADQLREQQHRSRQVLEALPIGVFVLSAEGETVYANAEAQQILGRGVAADAKPEELSERYQVYCTGTNDLYPTNKLPIVRALKGEYCTVEDMEVQRPDRRVPLQVTAGPIRSSNGSITGSIAAFSDISDRRAVERLKDELISVVSHELRTPLTSIRGALGLVGSGRLGTLNEQGKKMIDIAVTDTDRLVRLINDMLDIERMQSGRIEMHKASCDAADLTRQAVEGVQRIADAAGVQVEAVGADDTQLHCDSDRILQTLTNLLGNAIKFSPKGGVVTLRVVEREDEVEFRITDQGRGIPKEKIETIFERFQQVDASDAREKGGAGLGLAISRSIVVQHGGRIWAESDGENGSTFVFTLPRPTQASDQTVKTDPDSLLLVAEDDSSAAAVLRTMLETNGYSVAVAGTGTQAVEMAATLRPAAILLDIIMPEMNGWDAMAALKSNPRTANIPIIVVSGLTSEVPHSDDRVVAWVEKPFDETVLARALQKAFGDLTEPEVLIVEDDENLATVLTTQFEASGLRCMVARDGSEAIRLAQEREPNLLVLDLMLPERDGFDVVDWLRQHEQLRHLPLVVYTAIELDDAQKQQLTLGPSVFMTKAKEKPEEVARRVTHLLNRVSGRTNE